MKKLLLVLIILSICFCIIGCSENSNNSSLDESKNNSNFNLELETKPEITNQTENKDDSNNTNVNSKNETFSNHTHKFDVGSITRQATCSEQGIKTYYCTSCSATKTEAISQLQHKWQDATCGSPRNCTICGITTGSNVGEHSFLNNVCSCCGKEKIKFNYSYNTYPFEIKARNLREMLPLKIVSAKCYFKNNELWVDFIYSGGEKDGWYTLKIYLLYPETGIIIENIYDFFTEETVSSKTSSNKLLSQSNTIKLKPGEYFLSLTSY